MATYESELLVRDFGTHVVTSVDAGAALVQIDEIKSSFNRDYSSSKSKITATASASFFGVFHISASYEHQTTKEMIDQYNGLLTVVVKRPPNKKPDCSGTFPRATHQYALYCASP
jgi:hypothetical protein